MTGGACDGGDALTKGQFCSRVGAGVCDRTIACSLATAANRQACLQSFQTACCEADKSCGETAPNKQAEQQLQAYVTACSTAVMSFDCASLANGDVPVECTTLPAALELVPATPVTRARLTRPAVARLTWQVFSASP